MRGIGTSLSRRVALLLAATAFAVLGLTAVASAATFTVTDTTDAALANPTGTTCASTHGGSCTLRSAVQAADNLGGASTITVPAGDFQLSIASVTSDDPSTGDLDIYDVPGAGAHSVQLTITGAGASSTILDANGLDRYFAVDAATTGQNSLSISGVTIENGNQNDETPSDHSTGDTYGGAIYSDGILKVDSSVLKNNSAYYGGGAIYSDTSATSTSVTNSTATGNSTAEDPSYYGGGFVDVNSGSLTMTGDQITHNSGDYYGGAVVAYESGNTEGPITLSNSTMSDNVTYDESGGAMFLYYTGPITISNSDLSNNTAGDDEYGGAIYASETGLLTVTGSTFNNDGAADDDGGAIYTSTTDISVANSTFTNDSGCCGGAIYVDGTSATALQSITNSTFSGDHANSTEGGAIYDDNGDLVVNQSSFIDNSAAEYGGALYYDSGDGMSLTNDTFDGNQSGQYGGAIYLDEAATTGAITMLNDTIAHNTAFYGGGISYPYYANSIENTIIADNNGGAAQGTSYYGGGDCYYPATYTTYHADAGGNLDSDGTCFALASDKVAVNPLLGSAADNGGPTWTDALGAGSPAIGNATAADCPSADQRGVARSSTQGKCDIGAFQTAPAALTLSKAGPSSVTVGNPFNYTITVSDGGPGPSTGTTVTDQLPAGETLWGTTPSQGTCTTSGTPAKITCDLGVVNNGSSATVALVVSEANAGAVTNTATAANDQGASASASATTTVTKPAPAASTATAPKATTGGASGVSKHGARLAGRVTTGNQSTVYLFQYGKTTRYGMATAVFRLSSSASVSRAIGALLAGTKYHYRLVAVNTSGTSYGADRTFRTKPNKKKHKKHSRRHKR